MNTFEELQQKMAKFVEERNWTGYHNPKNLAMSITIEAAELMEIFQWMNIDESKKKSIHDVKTREALKDEIADIIIYILSIANVCQIDLKNAVLDKMKSNNSRFPVGTSL